MKEIFFKENAKVVNYFAGAGIRKTGTEAHSECEGFVWGSSWQSGKVRADWQRWKVRPR